MRVRIDATAARAHVAVYAAPVGLVARVEVRIEDSAEQVGARGGDVALDERVWGDRSSLAIAADALDESGNVVARGSANVARAPRAALAQGGASGEGESARDDGGVSGWVWVGGGALAIAAATVAILLVTAEDRYVLGEPMPR